METNVKCPCPICGIGMEIKKLADRVFETIKCPSCGSLLILKYDEIEKDGKEEPIWWFETAS